MVLDLNAVIMLDIGRGNRQWGDSTFDIESTVCVANKTKASFTGSNRSGASRSPADTSGPSGSKRNTGTVMFSKPYQSGKCNKSYTHRYVLNGRSCTVHHIRATCWLVEETQSPHSESSTD